jgi:general stress protein 26
MHTEEELKLKFWKALSSDMVMMLSLADVDDGHSRPMTAQLEEDQNSIWFFTSTDNALVKNIGKSSKGVATFVSKGHDLYATVHGKLTLDNDKATIDRLWNNFVAAWYEGGKDDPKLSLLRFDPSNGEVWLNGSSIVAGIKMLLGSDPKQDYKDNVAKVNFRAV